MKKKLVFSGIIVLALVLTTGTFAYTYTNTSATTLNGSFADGAWATYEPSVVQPDWKSIMPWGEDDMEILRPNGPGDETNIKYQHPQDGDHWDKVDDVNPDEENSCLITMYFNKYHTDLFEITDYSPAEEGMVKEIKNVTVFFRFAGFTDNEDHDAYARAVIKINGSVFEGTEEVQSGLKWTTRSYKWGGNPTNGKRWTWEDVNKLQAGVSLKAEKVRFPAFVTQVYVAVSYEKKITQSEVPTGYLFDITPHPEYTGDLQVKLYLTNTAELLKAYNYLNMELYVAKSLEAQRPPTIRVLSLENGVASFNIEGGSAGKYSVEVRGGAYRLVSSNPNDWAEGWSIVPELYCEVSQR